MRTAFSRMPLVAALVLLTAGATWAVTGSSNTNTPVDVRVSPKVSTDAITIPRLLSYQGKLTDSLGVPVADGNYQLTFRLYTQPTGGSAIWSEAQTILVRNGLFSALLGALAPITSVPDGGALYLSMQVAAGAELSPRLQLASTPYSFLAERAASSDQLQGKDTTGFVRTGQTGSVTSAMIVDGTVAAADLNQMGATTSQVLKWNGSAWAPAADSASGGDNAWVRGTPDSVLFTTHRVGLCRGGADNAMQGTYNYADVNFGSSCTTGYVGPANGNITISGGVFNSVSQYAGTVSGGQSNRVSGDYGTIAGGSLNQVTGGRSCIGGGMYNRALGDYSAVGGGYYDSVRAKYGGVLSGYGNAAGIAAGDTAACVVGGRANRATEMFSFVGGGRGNTAGGQFSAVPGGYNCSANGDYSAVPGGYSNAAGGSYSAVPGGRGNTASGAYSFAADSGSTASFVNSAAFNGTTTSAVRQLRCYVMAQGFGGLCIDDPRDPKGAIINQYSVGSSEALLTYRGAAVIGAGGRVTVSLPDYFDVLNRNPMVQLTGVGASDVYVAEDVSGNSFAIGGRPGTKVYWTVTGERKDDVAAEARTTMPVEQPKTDDLRGRSVNGLW